MKMNMGNMRHGAAVLAACASMSLCAADVVVDASRELGPVKPVDCPDAERRWT
ncbi:MAG: hypothetical protein IJI35_09935 [Kiritimatiellae bacterium]|nr:hypothetical protein [Kiritimatiellia bacterium]